MKRWDALCAKLKPKRPGKKQAKEYADMAGMKSIGEVRCAADLDTQGIKWKYEHETLSYQHRPQKYTPDFTLVDNDDLLIEYKGKMTNETRKKLLSIQRCNPKRRLCIVFERPNNKLSSRPNATRYWQWAERNGFKWSEQVIDPSWID
jgi:predicted nuclease of restriction endonuclease-like RecB superfamily